VSNSGDLNDAIGILKNIVGLPAPAPSWVFVDEKAALPKINDPILLGETDVKLVGILVGDVDGSWTG
jgi:hypothetical protein